METRETTKGSAELKFRIQFPPAVSLQTNQFPCRSRKRSAGGSALKSIVANDRFPRSPRIRRLKRILDKLEQGAEPPAEPRRGRPPR